MLAHHFPPMGGSGANRALAFTRYLAMYGWRATVITPGVEWAANRDDALLREVPSYVRVVRTGSFEARPRAQALQAKPAADHARPNAMRKQLGHLKRFPDAHAGWLPYALAAARREDYDVAYSSSGPFTSHLAGLLLKRLTSRPWVLELRDGWYAWNRAILPDYPRWRDALERGLEAAAVRSADRVLLVTERMAGQFRHQYSDLLPEHFCVVSNGFDPRQFEASAPAEKHTGWHLVHAGALYYGRSLTTLLRAAHQLSQSHASFAKDFRLRLIGTLDETARAEIAHSGVNVDVLPQTSHASAIATMRAADALLLVANTTEGAAATVPGKLFEYLALERPVLAIAPCESSTADVLRQTGGGWLGAADDANDITRALRRAYLERESPQVAGAVSRFDRRRLAGELACIFDGVT